jgi:hypothetical protein
MHDKLLGMKWQKIQSKVTQLKEATSLRMKPEITPHYFATEKNCLQNLYPVPKQHNNLSCFLPQAPLATFSNHAYFGLHK